MSKTWMDEREMPLLDDLLCGRKLWDDTKRLRERRKEMKKLYSKLQEEHQFLLDYEPPDEFHACVVLGAMNLISGLLK